VPGKSLGEFLRASGALTPVKAVTTLRAILDAVGHAHAQGIIHRDLKPSNILLDDNGTPRVMDFGIAARAGEADPALREYSGTPAYMAPNTSNGAKSALAAMFLPPAWFSTKC
jgi:eukaryotic-like serine/threonine-protein kinase